MERDQIKLYDLLDYYSPPKVLREIMHILSLIAPQADFSIVEQAYGDIIRLFNGEYPGYRASTTKYHNLEHTGSVVLAMCRLIHGLWLEGHAFSTRAIKLGVLAAIFHDTGLIQREDDTEGTGAKYTIGHEDRSIELMRNYLTPKGLAPEDIEECAHIIQCTILNQSPDSIPFRSEEIKLMGKAMGSADLLAQMADRLYLEKLPLLFMEFEEAHMPGFETPLELFKKTEQFYHSVAKSRLTNELDHVSQAARAHFRERWNIDRNLYTEAIDQNIRHIKITYDKCEEDYDCFIKNLRRKNR